MDYVINYKQTHIITLQVISARSLNGLAETFYWELAIDN